MFFFKEKFANGLVHLLGNVLPHKNSCNTVVLIKKYK